MNPMMMASGGGGMVGFNPLHAMIGAALLQHLSKRNVGTPNSLMHHLVRRAVAMQNGRALAGRLNGGAMASPMMGGQPMGGQPIGAMSAMSTPNGSFR